MPCVVCAADAELDALGLMCADADACTARMREWKHSGFPVPEQVIHEYADLPLETDIPVGPLIIPRHLAAHIYASPELLREADGLREQLGAALRGEIEFREPVPVRHRCLFCWLLGKLPGHSRCKNGHAYHEDCGEA